MSSYLQRFGFLVCFMSSHQVIGLVLALHVGVELHLTQYKLLSHIFIYLSICNSILSCFTSKHMLVTHQFFHDNFNDINHLLQIVFFFVYCFSIQKTYVRSQVSWVLTCMYHWLKFLTSYEIITKWKQNIKITCYF